MAIKTKNAVNTGLYAAVEDVTVNGIQRAIAVDTLRQADRITNAILWSASAVRRLFTRTADGKLSHNH
jgi:hypothetical protein